MSGNSQDVANLTRTTSTTSRAPSNGAQAMRRGNTSDSPGRQPDAIGPQTQRILIFPLATRDGNPVQNAISFNPKKKGICSKISSEEVRATNMFHGGVYTEHS